MAFLSPVLKNMKTFSGDDGVIIEACYLLRILCKHEQGVTKLMMQKSERRIRQYTIAQTTKGPMTWPKKQ
jgi:hypothetical protein